MTEMELDLSNVVSVTPIGLLTGGKKFKQTWTGNMKAKKAPKIDSYSKDDYTKITFRPDLARFKVDAMSDDMVSLFRKRAYDIAGTTPGLKVFLDGKRISFGTKDPFKDYCGMYTKVGTIKLA